MGTTSTLVPSPRPVASMISGAIAGTGAERKMTTNGIEARANRALLVKASDNAPANTPLSSSSSNAEPSVYPIRGR